ncbi:O-antigen ligase family protein [Candidatus Methylacidiphilum infernorum]|uniref:O-antigen ligase family protein n=1 Tax=Candidatus Methylacidiphilum infernorum TaxID=511746 RepID=A0ABX7PTZ9_9BACT|nr:O-antigen ligase family protein [Candidatus Methylacidiphilum infernorum]QSR86417.1 O-antigen ligase family protein [Candidatus Methylacidiphilum infernorum]
MFKNTLQNLLLPKTILYGVLILSPWLFGSVEPWAKQLFFFLILLAFILWVAKKKEENIWLFPGFVAGSCFLFYLLLQVLPLPSELVGFLSPERLEIAKKVSSFLPLPPGKEYPSVLCLSLNPKETYFYLIEWSGLALYGFLLFQLLSSRKEISSLILIMVINGLALTLFGVVQRATFNGKLYWVRELTQGGDPFGPYVLRTHMGGLLLLIVPLGLGYLFWQYSLFHEGFLSLAGLKDKDFFKKHLYLFFLLVISTGVLMSKSRGAIGSFLLSLFLLMGFITWGEKGNKRLSLFLFAFIFSAVLFTLWLASDLFLGTTERLIQTSVNEEARGEIWKEAMKLWKLFPLTGVGFGAFEDAFGMVRTVFPGPHRVAHAESDFIELLVEGGILGALPVIFCLARMIGVNGLKMQTMDDQDRKLAFGALCSFVGGLFQGIANFNMALMANMLYLLTAAVILSKVVVLGQKKEGSFVEKKSFPERKLSTLFRPSP